MAPDRSNQRLEFLTATIDVILHPPNHGLVDFMLTADVQLIPPYYLAPKTHKLCQTLQIRTLHILTQKQLQSEQCKYQLDGSTSFHPTQKNSSSHNKDMELHSKNSIINMSQRWRRCMHCNDQNSTFIVKSLCTAEQNISVFFLLPVKAVTEIVVEIHHFC